MRGPRLTAADLPEQMTRFRDIARDVEVWQPSPLRMSGRSLLPTNVALYVLPLLAGALASMLLLVARTGIGSPRL